MSATEPKIVRRGEGMPLVLIHGNGVDHRLLLSLDPVLEAVGGYERIYIDLPGCGETPALEGAGGLPEMADWLSSRLPELVGDARFAVVGNSMGGLLARDLAARFRGKVAGLALLAPVVDPDQDKRTLPDLEVFERDDHLLDELSEEDRGYFTAIAPRQTRDQWERFERYCIPGLRDADQAAMGRLSDRYYLASVPEERGEALDVPSLIVTGRQDSVVGYEDQYQLLEHYPRATYVALDGAGHNAHLDAPEPVGALVRYWAEEVLRTESRRGDHA